MHFLSPLPFVVAVPFVLAPRLRLMLWLIVMAVPLSLASAVVAVAAVCG